MAKKIITGSQALLRSLVCENVDLVFGYPGGSIMPVYDDLYDYRGKINHILTRHEQGAIHAAQGYARATGRPGVVIATSGPGATNLITGIADAKMDSTPLVVITGQVTTANLGSDTFQETDMIDITNPISKWAIQVRSAEEIPWAVARAFHIASTGRPGPVIIDIPKDAQTGTMHWHEYEKCDFIRSYEPVPDLDDDKIQLACEILDTAEQPLMIIGQGVILSHAEQEVLELIEKADMPVA
ncbi:MAG: thiamine pyrophosphate-binding protein [Muribaculaceae bacterium]|nr:thiamine pyrophosphate-binding protein [Muribaculaceae bacterium]